jgi:hypothetical protein
MSPLLPPCQSLFPLRLLVLLLLGLLLPPVHILLPLSSLPSSLLSLLPLLLLNQPPKGGEFPIGCAVARPLPMAHLMSTTNAQKRLLLRPPPSMCLSSAIS